MACLYTFGDKTYTVSEFDDFLRSLSAQEAALFMPQVKQALPTEGGMGVKAAEVLVQALSKKWRNAPAMVVVSDLQDPKVPQAVREHDRAQKKRGAQGQVEGFILDGTVYVVASAINSQQDLARVVFHEALGHYGLRGVFGPRLDTVLSELAQSRPELIAQKAREYGLSENAQAKDDADVIEGMSAKQVLEAAEEVLAEMAQTTPKQSLVKKAVGLIRAMLKSMGLRMELTDNDIVSQYIAPARGWVQGAGWMQQAFGNLAFSLNQSLSQDDKNALRSISELDDVFEQPKSDKTTVEGIASDIDPGMVVKKITNIPGRTQYNFTTADGNTSARLIVRPFNPYGESIYGYDLVDGKMSNEIVGRPGENPEDVPDADDVWIDVSLLEEGGGFGAKIYAIAANYAFNNDKVFIGDPAGLSDEALRRRTEQMISSALKFGTTQHLAPHPRQIAGDAALGVPPLKWVYGDDVGNIERMLKVSIESIDNAMPSAKNLGYEPTSGTFVDQTRGNPIGMDRLALGGFRAIQADRNLDRSGSKAGQVGWRTLARRALFASVLELQGRSGQGRGVLDILGTQLSDFGRGQGTAGAREKGQRIFYSRGGESLGGLNQAEQGSALPNISFSRSTVAQAANRGWQATQQLNLAAGYKLGDFLQKNSPISTWDKTVGTPYHLAQKNEAFKKVYDGVQNYLSDVSTFANRASDAAPTLLPSLQKLSDLNKRAVSVADSKALSKAVFEGTLSWTRDKKTRAPLEMKVLEDRAQRMSAEEKAQELLSDRLIYPNTLKMWKGLPLEQFEALVASKYETEKLQGGIVFTPQELQSLFKLTGEQQADGSWSGQIGLYQEFRAATDLSLANMALSEAANVLKLAPAEIDALMLTQTSGHVRKRFDDSISALIEIEEATQENTEVLDALYRLRDRTGKLMERGYAPLMRYGNHTVTVRDAAGEMQYFSMYETAAQANKAARDLKDEFEGQEIVVGVMSEQAHKLFAGVTPEALAVFGQATGQANNEVYEQYLKLAVANRSALKRMIRRKGVAGYNDDATRALASFVLSNARKTAANLHMESNKLAAEKIRDGATKDEAIKLIDYVQNPQENTLSAAVRGVMFFNFLGGSVASAVVNLSQSLTMTAPYLRQFTNEAGVVKRMGEAFTLAAKGVNKRTDAALFEAMERATASGTLNPQEIAHLQSMANGQGSLKAGDGSKLGDAAATASNAWSRFSVVWGAMFGLAEQYNRRVAFIAAFRLAQEQGMADPFGFAEKAVAETQGTYNRGNKPNWARGSAGSVLFTFKQFQVGYLEYLSRMYAKGAVGKKAVLVALGMLMLMSGLEGLPGADDLDDLIDGIMQRVFDRNFSSKQKKREIARAIMPPWLAEFALKGLSSLPGSPIDVSSRLGVGNVLPGTGLLTKKDSYASDVAELVGPAGSYVQSMAKAAGHAMDGEFGKAAKEAAPLALKNLAKSADMLSTGAYRDDKGRIVEKTTAGDAFFKALGFQPNRVAEEQQRVRGAQQTIANNKLVESEIADMWAQGRFERDQSKIDEAKQRLETWNRNNPSTPIRIDAQQINKRVQEMNRTKAQRIMKSAPKEIRKTVREQLEAA